MGDDGSKYLCYLDVLGFKNRISDLNFAESYNYIIKEVIEPYDYNDKVYFLSDSIVIISENFGSLVDNCLSIYSLALGKGIFIRGAISKGLINTPYVVQEIGNKVIIPYFGEPFLKAYEIEQNINCAGICIEQSKYEELGDEEKNLFFSYKELFPKVNEEQEKYFLINDMQNNWNIPQTIIAQIYTQINNISKHDNVKFINTFLLYYNVMATKYNDTNNLERYHNWWIDILRKL